MDEAFLNELHGLLANRAKQLYRGERAYEGVTAEDIVNDVIVEIAGFLRNEAPLADKKAKIATYDDLRGYAFKRLRTLHNTVRRRAERRFTNGPRAEELLTHGLLVDPAPGPDVAVYSIDFFEEVRAGLRNDDEVGHDLLYVIEHYDFFCARLGPFDIRDVDLLAGGLGHPNVQVTKAWKRIQTLVRQQARKRRRLAGRGSITREGGHD